MASACIDIAPQLAAMADMAAAVEGFAERAELPAALVFAVQLCVEEAVSNVIRHGGLAPEQSVRLSLAREPGAVLAEVSDPGPEFDPLGVPPPPPFTSIEEASIGGRGIALMRRYCPQIAYERRQGINRLRLRFPLAA